MMCWPRRCSGILYQKLRAAGNFLKHLPISSEEKEQIVHGNAENLLRL